MKSKLGAIFSTEDGIMITYYRFQKKLRECVGQIGLDPKDFSTHSFRRGFAILAFQCDIPPEHIQFLGDWCKCYLKLSWTDKVKILNRMFNYS